MGVRHQNWVSPPNRCGKNPGIWISFVPRGAESRPFCAREVDWRNRVLAVSMCKLPLGVLWAGLADPAGARAAGPLGRAWPAIERRSSSNLHLPGGRGLHLGPKHYAWSGGSGIAPYAELALTGH